MEAFGKAEFAEAGHCSNDDNKKVYDRTIENFSRNDDCKSTPQAKCRPTKRKINRSCIS